MRIKIKSFATFRNILENEREMEVAEGTTVAALLDLLIKERPPLRDAMFEAPGVLLDHVNILRNGRNIHFEDGLETRIADKDVISLFPPVGGG
ncbi:MoaD family protein [Methanofollis formosanus]|uniref:MoaD family protein n=1 Tax=Methanofollis formosanus TaxID=299308 RepID=A0A8G0ZZH6_9EURY|nr:ubiquitin-like small modifier protein 1 [Methanofollis formosanus]QYZ78517.1 MoaD family protein [Methanofollis formosanus]